MRQLAALVVVFCALSPTLFAADKGKWTVMCYLAADNDLETPMMDDLREMLAVGSNQDVKIVALVKRSPKSKPEERYSNKPVANLSDWATAKLLLVEKGKLRELADWGTADTGNPETLKKFIVTAAQECPAEHLALIMSDHGASWPGLCFDESHGNSFLTTKALGAVLGEATKKIGPLEVMGFDACLMANMEAAATVAPFAKYLIASEEVEPGSGWSYTALLTALETKPDMDGAEFGEVTAQTYKQSFDNSPAKHVQHAGMGVTLSVVDLRKIGEVEKAVKGLSEACAAALKDKGRPGWLAVARARSQAEHYGGEEAIGDSGMCMLDICHFASLLKKTGVQDFAAPVDALEKAIQSAVLFKIAGKARPFSRGLSVFFPEDPQMLALPQPTHYGDLSFASEADWEPMLEQYCAIASGDDSAPDMGDVTADGQELGEGASISLDAKVDADDVETAAFVLTRKIGENHLVIGQIEMEPDDNGKLHRKWSGKWFTLEDGEKKLTCPITGMEEVDDAENAYFAEVPVQVMGDGEEEWIDARLYFYLDFNDEELTGEFVYAFMDTKCGPREIEISTKDKIRPVYVKIDAKGKESLVASDEEDHIIVVDDPDDLTVGRERVSKGKYAIGFTVTDYAGNVDQAFWDVDVE